MAHSTISYLLHWGKEQCDVIFIWARDSICCITGLLIILFFYDPCICVCIMCVVRFWSLANKGHIQRSMYLPLMIISWKLACHYDHYIYEWGKRLQWHCAIIDEIYFYNILGKCECVVVVAYWSNAALLEVSFHPCSSNDTPRINTRGSDYYPKYEHSRVHIYIKLDRVK